MILLQANQIARLFGAEVLFRNIHLEIATKARIGLVGRNGAGKSTLLKIIAGIEAPDEGTIAKNKTATLGYLAQDTGLTSEATIWDEMLALSKVGLQFQGKDIPFPVASPFRCKQRCPFSLIYQ